MTRDLTCIVCPKGCKITVEIENGAVVNVSGNSCPRGKEYAVQECLHPMRTVTSTAKTDKGTVIPVKTNRPIPKELMKDCMKEINRAVVILPAQIGDVVIADVLHTGVDVVVTANRE